MYRFPVDGRDGNVSTSNGGRGRGRRERQREKRGDVWPHKSVAKGEYVGGGAAAAVAAAVLDLPNSTPDRNFGAE